MLVNRIQELERGNAELRKAGSNSAASFVETDWRVRDSHGLTLEHSTSLALDELAVSKYSSF